MDKKKVLIVEDDEGVRIAICKGLQDLFEVYGAGTVAEARDLARRHWDDLAVVVFDMELDDPTIKGAEIGIDLQRERWHSSTPEFIIYSQFYDSDYYRLAGRLRAAAYLEKSHYKDPDLIRHVKALALSHSLSVENPGTANRIRLIAAHSEKPSQALLKFCEEILRPEVAECLGTPFVILFSDENKTYCCSSNIEWPRECPAFFPRLQDYVHGRKNMSEPFVFDFEQVADQFEDAVTHLARQFDQGAFVPLPTFEDFRISIGIIQQASSDTNAEPGDAIALGSVLVQYLRPTAIANILKILRQWTALNATLTNTAKLCLVVGQELKYLLPPRNAGEAAWSDDSLDQLWDLGDDLYDTGQLLREVQERRMEGKTKPVQIREIVENSWHLITRGEDHPERESKFEGSCVVEGDERDLIIAVSRLLHWLAQRRSATPPDRDPLISVRCFDDEERPTIIFEDASERLSEKLRAEMFATFSIAVPVPVVPDNPAQQDLASEPASNARQGRPEGRYLPLYLAQILVEGRYQGTLTDHSDDEDFRSLNYGHRIVMQFPPNRMSITGQQP